ncbi:histidine kinase [Cellulomonas fimi]|uniref:sensor histidine kinase n=1 Tax=Cellulomonas fimi TaxID=1708 RepID=UPI00234CDD82|nr:histidine kinase [Cellulomonas fimi]MDC7121352.1 histidine kinase [Cellulomonas fimi]
MRPTDDPTTVAWTTLAAGGGAGAAGEPRPVRTWRVFGQVVAAAGLVLVLVAVLGLTASRQIAERESVNDAARRTDLLAEAVVQPALRDGLATGDPDALAALDQAVRDGVLDDQVVRVKVWDADGRIVYSDEDRLVGQRFPLGDDERAVLADPATEAEVSDLDKPENAFERGQGKLLEVYRPVWTPDGTPLLFETYSRYDAVTERSTALWRGFAGITLTSLLVLVVLMLPVLWTLLDRLRRSQQHREVLLQHAVEASDEERRRIAGTLHDGVVQELAAASFALAGAADRADRAGAPDVATPVRDAAATVRASIQGLRSLLVDIYPASLRTAGLRAALADLVGGLAVRGVDVRLDAPDGVAEGLPAPVERLVHRVAQETLRNAVAHSGARHVDVVLRRGDGTVVLEVADDGVGFDVAATLARPPEGHLGLRLLADLASSAGARLEVASAPGTGCRWRLTARTDGLVTDGLGTDGLGTDGWDVDEVDAERTGAPVSATDRSEDA